MTGPEHLRFYAGGLPIGRDGLPPGTLCVLDRQSRRLEQEAAHVLLELAGAVAELLELRRLDAAAGLGERQVLTDSHCLRAGIDAGQSQVHYQPVVDLPFQRWLGVEALVRWTHPQRGLLPPGGLPAAGRGPRRRTCTWPSASPVAS